MTTKDLEPVAGNGLLHRRLSAGCGDRSSNDGLYSIRICPAAHGGSVESQARHDRSGIRNAVAIREESL